MSKSVVASIGDDGVLNTRLPPSVSEVWIDRDLSWLDFNERVLAEALDARTPLLEKAKFLAIFTSNLDEFFICLRDRREAWVLQSDGNYSQLHPDEDSDGPEALGTHQTLMKLAHARTGA